MRTRFAPSPTGYLHVGGLRTALYAYLLAKQTDGKFLLRIEDTDQERSVPGTVESILRSLHWAGIDPQEGVILDNGVVAQTGGLGPYIQSERLDLYKEHAEHLLRNGHAYPCFCTSERLDQMRKDQEKFGQAPMYDRLCLHLSPEETAKRIAAGEKHVLRLKVPRDRVIEFDDDIRGKVSFQGSTVDDQVLMKSDGFPTYHLAHVVDDHLMEIDVVLRGEEWLSSTPKHLILFEAFGWAAPRYAHVSLMLNTDRTKLSKRQNSVSVEEYMEKGYLPEALVNFIALLGWNPGTEQELFTLQELVDAFSLERVQKSGAIFDVVKLDWLQGQWMRRLPLETLAVRIQPIVAKKHPAAETDSAFAQKTALIQERITFFHEAPDMLGYFYERPAPNMDILVNEKQKVTKELLPEVLMALTELLGAVTDDNWNEEKLKELLFAACEERGWKKGQLLWPLRAALTAREYSPGAFEVAALLGREETLHRVAEAQRATVA